MATALPTQAPLFFESATQFRAWLKAHGATTSELIVGFHKVGSGKPSMSWSESVDEALCFGWIDGVRTRIDDHTYKIRFTPRKAGSIWSVVNVAKVEALIAQDRMQPAGLAAYAKRSEAKTGIYSHERTEAPEFTAAEIRSFKKNKQAWLYFESTPPGYKRQVTHWVINVKQAATRERRLAKLIATCEAGERMQM